ncbi:hypothetical protein [Pseudomonas asplenii]|uniref:hypothetical protein n=1 Tax=Pseudomonas asplenii TaxID=53407 RepID=UPI0006CC6805|nr:hypothetical protein [Pseudomonas fuscovaginae]KPA96929.1 hypothetical protein PF70_03085 [Pseudomonas fuscovaginae]
MNAPTLHMDSVSLFKLLKARGGIASMRTHSDLLRTFEKALQELVDAGVLIHSPMEWTANGAVVVQVSYGKDDGKAFEGLQFGSWFCLAMALKVTKPEIREALTEALKKHPIY